MSYCETLDAEFSGYEAEIYNQTSWKPGFAALYIKALRKGAWNLVSTPSVLVIYYDATVHKKCKAPQKTKRKVLL